MMFSREMMAAKPAPTKEQRMYDALLRIARHYQTSDQIRRSSEKQYGLDYEEALGYAYDNIQNDAKNAIHGMRRPK